MVFDKEWKKIVRDRNEFSEISELIDIEQITILGISE